MAEIWNECNRIAQRGAAAQPQPNARGVTTSLIAEKPLCRVALTGATSSPTGEMCTVAGAKTIPVPDNLQVDISGILSSIMCNRLRIKTKQRGTAYGNSL